MRKILYLTPGCFDKGGISRYNRYQIRSLRELEGEVNIKVFSLFGRQKGDFEEEFKISWNGWGASISSKIVFTIKVLINVIFWKPDIVWLGHINLTEILVKTGLINKIKSVLNIYGLEVWSGLRPNVEKGFKGVSHVVSDCHFTANYAEEEGFRSSNSVDVIWDCVDLDRFSPSENNEKDQFFKKYNLPDPSVNPWILTLGRLTHTASHKGYERLLEVFSKVVLKDDKSVLIYAGKGDIIDALKKLADKLNVSDRVFFSGMVHEDDLVKFYRASRVFSLVSDRGVGRGEGIPLTPLEAMACGSPIIVGNQDGSQEAIFNNENGFCISPFNLELHENILLSIVKDDKKFENLSKSSIKIAREYFSYKIFKMKHQDFLNKISNG
ncbi:glycosyltransferase family 4 protein [uncultured Polaribacter sp.]|uniref:glycosyltransferase family 4 protein n=1 Tax=uncultured Polaribacter sp. TaxID=174711 RepID=UPI002631E5CA|nr:glycosyltransferase family 4 protein [uncultured Polaribacter sp.]